MKRSTPRHLAALLLLAVPAALTAADVPPTDWRQVATEGDRIRLRRWRQAWTDALARLRAGGTDATLAEDLLYEPDRALPDALPPPGRYTCRIVKLGANGAGMRDLTVYPPTECGVALQGTVTRLYKIAGTQRPIGTLYPDGAARTVFLGTLVFGDETKPLAYGRDARRDVAGYVERIGPRRWRLVLPYPRFESLLDVVELTPAP